MYNEAISYAGRIRRIYRKKEHVGKMAKVFNVNGACRPDRHYMVNIEPRLREIKEMVDKGEYFTINRARQYGKTTTLKALADYLRERYVVISLDFQRMSSSDFENESSFTSGLAREITNKIRRRTDVAADVKTALKKFTDTDVSHKKIAEIFDCFTEWCEQSTLPVVLIIDEVDTASNNQVFLDFLAQLRAAYLDSDETPTFQSVILAGVYDIRNIRGKIRREDQHQKNSPWNIAAKFDVQMYFSTEDIAGMLAQYEADFQTGMDIKQIAEIISDYTSGYPYLVSALCKIMDEEIAGIGGFEDKTTVWTKKGIEEAVKRFLMEKNPLFDSLIEKLNVYPEMKAMIYRLLFQGQTISYNADDPATDLLLMFGFAKVENANVEIANRIFETRLYNYFLTLPEVQTGDMYKLALRSKNQFIQNGQLDMKQILTKFVEHFDDIYGDQSLKFVEEDGRRYFMLYLKPIINGTGNYYVESRTRNQERTDLIVDYHGMQYIIEIDKLLIEAVV